MSIFQINHSLALVVLTNHKLLTVRQVFCTFGLYYYTENLPTWVKVILRNNLIKKTITSLSYPI